MTIGSATSAILPPGNSDGLVTVTVFLSSVVTWYDHVGRGRDQVEAELALEALGHDLEVQQAEESAAETEAERDGCLRLVDQRGIGELELVERVAQQRVVAAVDRIQPREHHRAWARGSPASAWWPAWPRS